MDVNAMYREIFIETLGLDTLGLEGTFQDCVKIVESKTLVTFSNYIPCLYRFLVDLTDKSHIIRNDINSLGVEYYLDDPILEKYHLPILGIEKIDYNNSGDVDPYDPNSSQYYSSIIASRNNITLESVLMGAEYTYNRTLTDFAMPWKRYYEYRGGNVLYMRNYTFDNTCEITAKVPYPNITAIPEEYREIFIKLACMDIKIWLWASLQYLTAISNPVGNIELRFDWSNVEQEREEFLRDLRSRSFPDRVANRYFTVC